MHADLKQLNRCPLRGGSVVVGPFSAPYEAPWSGIGGILPSHTCTRAPQEVTSLDEGKGTGFLAPRRVGKLHREIKKSGESRASPRAGRDHNKRQAGHLKAGSGALKGLSMKTRRLREAVSMCSTPRNAANVAAKLCR